MQPLYSHPDIPAIMSIAGNSVCCACNKENPTFVSLNNGIFLCSTCAEFHQKKLDNEISQILSLQTTPFTDEQILYLSLGGNHKYLICLAEFNITPDSSLELRFKSKAADYYRSLLKDKVAQKIDKNYKDKVIYKPSIERGQQIIEYYKESNDGKKNQGNNNTNMGNRRRRGSNRNRILANIVEQGNENLKYVAQSAGEGIKNLAVGAGEGIVNIFNQAKNYIMGEGGQNGEDGKGNKINDLNNINNENSNEINNIENGRNQNNIQAHETDEQAQQRRDKEKKNNNEKEDIEENGSNNIRNPSE